jgi:hypothetical protein
LRGFSIIQYGMGDKMNKIYKNEEWLEYYEKKAIK